jgi:hypothetical protein
LYEVEGVAGWYQASELTSDLFCTLRAAFTPSADADEGLVRLSNPVPTWFDDLFGPACNVSTGVVFRIKGDVCSAEVLWQLVASATSGGNSACTYCGTKREGMTQRKLLKP